MPQSKTSPKDRYTRQRQGRAIRRTLAAISPSNSHSQQQSPLFSVLPAELRLLIYKDALSQHLDLSRPINTNSKTPLFRPGHTHYTTVSTTLLSTCRLVYYEAHAIPLRSATHHFRYLNSADWRYTGDTWLQHITSQRGAELYHLHDNVTAYDRGDFTKFLLPHLQWKRITWTVCAGSGPIDRLSKKLSELVLPSSCREVMVELESQEVFLGHYPRICEEARVCAALALTRSDGEKLEFDGQLALRYTWLGVGLSRLEGTDRWRESSNMQCQTIRLCWREKVPRREYVSYDRLCCMGIERSERVKDVSAFDSFEGVRL